MPARNVRTCPTCGSRLLHIPSGGGGWIDKGEADGKRYCGIFQKYEGLSGHLRGIFGWWHDTLFGDVPGSEREVLMKRFGVRQPKGLYCPRGHISMQDAEPKEAVVASA